MPNPILNLPLKTAIVATGKKQRRIATLAHISESHLSFIVRGRRAPTAAQRERLAKVLSRTEQELFAKALET